MTNELRDFLLTSVYSGILSILIGISIFYYLFKKYKKEGYVKLDFKLFFAIFIFIINGIVTIYKNIF
jgi:uncharacterized membrane protein HdeD (DUF308 family)